jgi:hypothetical protein
MNFYHLYQAILTTSSVDDDDLLFNYILPSATPLLWFKYYYERNPLRLRDFLTKEMNRLASGKIPRASMHDPHRSAWVKLFRTGNQQAMIAFTGFDYRTFYYILEKVKMYYDWHTPYGERYGTIRRFKRKPNRPRIMDAHTCLGALLHWTKSRGSQVSASLIFGVTTTTLSIFVRFMRRIIVKTLVTDPYAKIRMPTDEEAEAYKIAITHKYNLLPNVYCTMDGLKLLIEANEHPDIQRKFYNGWKTEHFISNVLVFAPDGTIIAMAHSLPGSMHDSNVARNHGLYFKLMVAFEKHGGECVADTAFSNLPCILKTSQTPPRDTIRMRKIWFQKIQIRQSSEWGMRAFQAQFPRTKDRFIYDEAGRRQEIIKCIALLYNLRARMVGLNEIKTTFMPFMHRDVRFRADGEIANEIIYEQPDPNQE